MSPPTPCGLAGIRALLVDDNATNRRILSTQLASWGIQLQHTGSPHEALARRERGASYELLLVDYHVPEMDGLALAAEVPRKASSRSITIALLSSSCLSVESREAALKVVNGVLTKPIKQSQLHDALVTLLAGKVAATARPIPLAASSPALPPLRVLVAEDNEMNRRLVQLMIRSLGQRKDFANNGREAVEALRRAVYDVVLMDCSMPELDGFEATRLIRQAGNRQPFIVAMTGHVMEGDRERCLAAGMDDYLTKPVTLEHLSNALARASSVIPRRAMATDVDAPALEGLTSILGADATAHIVSMYIEQTPRVIEQLRSAVVQRDSVRARSLAGDLRANHETVGARECERAARVIEELVLQDGFEEAARHVQELEARPTIARRLLAGVRLP